MFDLASSYLRELRTWRRLLFDAFHRHERILWPLASQPSVCLETTLGLLNFFRWWKTYDIAILALANRQLMIDYMQSTKPAPDESNKPKVRRKRKRVDLYGTFRLDIVNLPRNIRMKLHHPVS